MPIEYTKDLLEKLILECSSYREIIKRTGRADGGGESYRLLKKKIAEYGLDDSKIKENRQTIDDKYRGGPKRKYTPEEVFRKNSPVTQRVLRKYVENYKILIYECSVCGFDGEGWEGKIALDLDHINGDNMPKLSR